MVSIAGQYRKGKSYVLSEAFEQPEVFPLGHHFDPETMGIWMWVVPRKIRVRGIKIICCLKQKVPRIDSQVLNCSPGDHTQDVFKPRLNDPTFLSNTVCWIHRIILPPLVQTFSYRILSEEQCLMFTKSANNERRPRVDGNGRQ